jgi:hypothetical protein
VAIQKDFPVIRGGQTGDDVKTRGLSRTVGPQQANGFAPTYSQANIPQNWAIAIALADLLHGKTAVLGN